MQLSTILKGTVAATALWWSMAAVAGNIPQYSFSQSEGNFTFLTDATPVTVAYNTASEMVFPSRQTLNAYTGEGFKIGFDFKYGGRVFNQFAINNNGFIQLGYDKVEFRGYCNLFFDDATRYASNTFFMGISPSMYGIKEGEVSYKLEGTEGNRTMTIEFAHLNIREPNTRGNAIYSLQIVLYEKNGEVRFNFLEEESPYSTFGLVCGIYGWSNDDSMLITSTGMGESAHISTGTVATMIHRDALLIWDADDILGFEHENPYDYIFAFTPTGSPDFVCQAPTELFVEQDGSDALISCTRSADAPATAILVSEKPILEYPEQGVSYPVYNDEGELITKFGDATLVYYGNDETPSAVYPNLKTSTRYYVKAIGVNGYPSYSFETAADLEFISSHPAPYNMKATSASHAINISTNGDYDVVIAATTERIDHVSQGATGIFGKPHDDVAVGDMIEGGGQVIYIGEPGAFTYDKAEPNRETFFRAWSLKDGRLSKTYLNAAGVTNPEMPFVPEVELYTLNQVPLGWTSQSSNSDATFSGYFVPRTRGENEDEPAIGGVSSNSVSSLSTPNINFGAGATLKFEWSMETARDYKGHEGDMVVLPEGNKPGEFGTGHQFRVFVTGRGNVEADLFTTNHYDGTMKVSPNDEDHFISGTSEMFPVSVEMPENITGGKVTFTFSTEGFSILYLRNITITSSTGVDTKVATDGQDVLAAGEGILNILSAEGGLYDVYSVAGTHVAQVKLVAGEGASVALEKGVYILNGQKYIVK